MNYKTLSFYLVTFCISLNAQDVRHERAKERLYQREQELASQKQTTEVTKQQKLLRRAKRRIARIEREQLVAAYKEHKKSMVKEAVTGEYAHIYPIPVWDKPLRYSYNVHQGSVDFTHKRYSKVFDANSALQHASALEIGAEPLVKDVFFISQAAHSLGAVSKDGAQFIDDLALVPLSFTGDRQENKFDFSYTHAFKNNRCMIGATISVIESTRDLNMYPLLNTVQSTLFKDKSKLKNGVVSALGSPRNQIFREYYGANVKTCMDDILLHKGMVLDQRHHQVSLGDYNFFITGVIESRRFERCHIGAQITLPGAIVTDHTQFAPVQIGNGGFVQAAVFASTLFKEIRGIHPHMQIGVQASLPRSIQTRVPKLIAGLDGSGALLMDNLVGAIDFSTGQSESTIPAFAQNHTKLNIRPGIESKMSIGALFAPAFIPDLQCDVQYKGSVSLAPTVDIAANEESWDVSWWENLSHSVAHQVHFNMIYQPTDEIQFEAGVFATVAGMQAPMEYGYRFSAAYNW